MKQKLASLWCSVQVKDVAGNGHFTSPLQQHLFAIMNSYKVGRGLGYIFSSAFTSLGFRRIYCSPNERLRMERRFEERTCCMLSTMS